MYENNSKYIKNEQNDQKSRIILVGVGGLT